MATEWKKTPDDKIRDKFDDKIKKIDSNKDQAYTDEEIQDFLENDKNSKKVCQLWELMNEHFETQTEALEQFKEIIWRICERILASVEQGKSIDLNRWRILYFYLKHFHRENTWVWRDIIKSVVDWSKWNRYESVARDLQNNNEEWFNNLPWVTEIRADLKREQDSKKCNEILESQNRLSSEDIQWLNEYKNNWNLDEELINKITDRLDLERCYQLLELTDLSSEDIEWLEIQKNNWKFNSELCNKITQKLNLEKEKKCNKILESGDTLSQEDVQWLKKYRDNTENLSQTIIDKIDERLRLEEVNENITRSVDADMTRDPLSNLEIISPWFWKVKPNWKLIVQKITPDDTKKIETESDVNKLAEKIKATITVENISQFITIPKWVSEEDLGYITCNFQNILIKHLCLHPGYKIFRWKDPNAYATGMNLENLTIENKLLESAFKKLEEWKNGNGRTKFDQLKPKQKEEQLRKIFGENNHILFDLRLKNVLNSCDNKKIWEIISYIINYSNQKYPGKLNDFAKNNTFISSVVQEYNAAKQKAEEEKKRVEEENRIIAEVNSYINQAKTVNVPAGIRNQFRGESSFKVLSRKQIESFKPYYDKIKWQRWNYKAYEWFCKLYEYSTNFYNFDWFWKLWLPNCLEAQDYLNYLWTFNNLQQNIDKINREYQEAIRKPVAELGDLWDTGIWGQLQRQSASNKVAAAVGKQAKKTNNELIVCAREFVKLRKKSGWSYRPDNFMWIKLDRNNSNKNPNNNSDVDDIIRDSLREGVVDKVKSFWRNATWWCYQQAFWDLVWLWTWLVLSGLTMTFTGSPALAGASFYLGSKLGNWVAQAGWDLVVDWLWWKVLWLWGESWNNKYDGNRGRDSFRVWIGQGTRDENGNIIDAKSWWEWAIDTTFGTVATAATFQIASSFWITVTENPFKYASIDEFINKPLSNIWAAAVKASIWTPSYEWVSVGDAILSQAEEEYWVQWMTKKCINVFLVTAMVKWYRATYNRSKNHSDIIWRIDQKLDKISSFLKSKWTSIEKLSDIPESGMKKLLKEGLSELVDDLAVESKKWWNSIIVPMVPLAISWLISPMLSPTGILSRRRDRVKEKIKTAKTQDEKDRYEKLLTRYDNIEKYINEKILAPSRDMTNNNQSESDWIWEELQQAQTQVDQQIENDFMIWDIESWNSWDPSTDGPKTYSG